MTPEDFFERLKTLPNPTIHHAGGDHVLNPEMLQGQTPDALRQTLRPAAVLIGLQDNNIILTRRSAKLRAHRGEIAFPGGAIDMGDASPEAAALREADEEIGLPLNSATPIKTMPDYLSRSGFTITPVIAAIAPDFTPTPSPDEVAEVFSVPLQFLMNLDNHRMEQRHFEGKDRSFYAIPYKTYRIWGVTAGIIHALAVAVQS